MGEKRRIVIATHNRDKVKEIRKVLKNPSLHLMGLERFPAYGVRETGKTLKANALLKARRGVKETGFPCLADDTGLEVSALKGAPGVYSARFAGPDCTYEDNCRKLLRVMRNVAGSRRRRAVFRCCVALVFPDGEERVFEGRCPGIIVESPRGKRGFGYDPLFQPGGSAKTFAEMTISEKNKISHRARAFAKAAAYLARAGKNR